MRQKECKYYGIHACLNLFERRKEDIIRVYIDESNVPAFKKVLKWCAASKKAYHIVSSEELSKVSDSVHHEGIVFLAAQKPHIAETDFFNKLSQQKGPCILLYFDGVQNPHNIGSIVRTCAHFGVPFILGKQGELPTLSPSLCRIAKGGVEELDFVALSRPELVLNRLVKMGFELVGTSSHAKESLYTHSFSKKTVIVFGAESTGMSKALEKSLRKTVKIPGTDLVESLNVAVGAALVIGEGYRQLFT